MFLTCLTWKRMLDCPEHTQTSPILMSVMTTCSLSPEAEVAVTVMV